MQARDTLVVLGGIGCDGTISRESDIMLFSTAGSNIRTAQRLNLPSLSGDSQIPRPLLVGSSVVLTKDMTIAIISGAATCFSMGTFCRFSPLLPSPPPLPSFFYTSLFLRTIRCLQSVPSCFVAHYHALAGDAVCSCFGLWMARFVGPFALQRL